MAYCVRGRGVVSAHLASDDRAVEAAWAALGFTVERSAVTRALWAAQAAAHEAQPGTSEDHPYKIRCSCGVWNYDHGAHVEREIGTAP